MPADRHPAVAGRTADPPAREPDGPELTTIRVLAVGDVVGGPGRRLYKMAASKNGAFRSGAAVEADAVAEPAPPPASAPAPQVRANGIVGGKLGGHQ